MDLDAVCDSRSVMSQSAKEIAALVQIKTKMI